MGKYHIQIIAHPIEKDKNGDNATNTEKSAVSVLTQGKGVDLVQLDSILDELKTKICDLSSMEAIHSFLITQPPSKPQKPTN